MKFTHTLTACFLLLGGALLLGGCDNSLSPFNRTDGFYSIYGHLDLYEAHNYIRVKDLNSPLRGDSTRKFPGTVTFENLDTGNSEVMEDTVIRFDDVYAHNFRTSLPMRPGDRYRVRAESPSGETAYAAATAPRIAGREVKPTGENCVTPIRMAFRPVESHTNLSVEIGIEYNNKRFWATGTTHEGDEPGETLVSMSPITQIFTPQIVIDNALEGLDLEVECYMLDTVRLYVRYTHYGPDFFEKIESDSLDIPGGIGRFGALYRDSFSFVIDTTRVDPFAGNLRDRPAGPAASLRQHIETSVHR